MNFLFTVALNSSNGSVYKTIMQLFRDLAITLETLGHKTFIISDHSAYMHYDQYTNIFLTKTFTEENYDNIMHIVGFKPDFAFIWNGNTEADEKTIKLLKSNDIQMIYGELGFLKHFNKTCYFDLSGVNCKITDIAHDLSSDDLSDDDVILYNSLIDDNIKPRLYENPFIFIPLQVESDTQITKYSPFKTMDEFLEYINDIFKNDNRTILFKQHPLKHAEIKSYNKFIEVTEDVHHYLPYADIVVGINSTVLTETLIYHDRIIALGAGVVSKHLSNDNQRKHYILQLYKKQLNWSDLADPKLFKETILYRNLLEISTK